MVTWARRLLIYLMFDIELSSNFWTGTRWKWTHERVRWVQVRDFFLWSSHAVENIPFHSFCNSLKLNYRSQEWSDSKCSHSNQSISNFRRMYFFPNQCRSIRWKSKMTIKIPKMLAEIDTQEILWSAVLFQSKITRTQCRQTTEYNDISSLGYSN